MFENFKENLINMLTSRVFVLIIVMIGISSVMIHQVFDLQIVHGEEYLESFQMKMNWRMQLQLKTYMRVDVTKI